MPQSGRFSASRSHQPIESRHATQGLSDRRQTLRSLLDGTRTVVGTVSRRGAVQMHIGGTCKKLAMSTSLLDDFDLRCIDQIRTGTAQELVVSGNAIA